MMVLNPKSYFLNPKPLLQGTMVIVPAGPLGTSIRNYGPTAGLFDPDRWMTEPSCTAATVLDGGGRNTGEVPAAAAAATAAAGDVPAAAAASAAALDVPAGAAATAAAAGEVPAAASASAAPPEPLTFSLGARDCVGQTLARLELQVMVASLVAAFEWTPGHMLEEMMVVKQKQQEEGGAAPAGAESHVASGVQVLYDIGQCHLTLQPQHGKMMLKPAPRA